MDISKSATVDKPSVLEPAAVVAVVSLGSFISSYLDAVPGASAVNFITPLKSPELNVPVKEPLETDTSPLAFAVVLPSVSLPNP